MLGRGTSGAVHSAEDRLTGGTVALKIFDGEPGARSARVRREISSLRLLQVPGVARLLDEGVDHGRFFLVTDLVEGRPFPGLDRTTWHGMAESTRALLETLERVHAAGIIHRDIKPANVLVGPHGRVTVLDFGSSLPPLDAARSSRDGMLVGTPRYLAPEQLQRLFTAVTAAASPPRL